MPTCLRLFWHCVRAAASRTFCTAGTSKAMRMAIIAMTTRSSIKVKPDRRLMTLLPNEKGMRVFGTLTAPGKLCLRFALARAGWSARAHQEDLPPAIETPVRAARTPAGPFRDSGAQAQDARSAHGASSDGQIGQAQRGG